MFLSPRVGAPSETEVNSKLSLFNERKRLVLAKSSWQFHSQTKPIRGTKEIKVPSDKLAFVVDPEKWRSAKQR